MKKPIILTVDDERINLMLFEANFEEKYTVITALSGKKALEIIQENPEIQIVFTDMKMPEMNGLEFIQKAKNILPQIPYIMLSGYDISEEIKTAIDTKLLTNYYSKPINLSEIENMLSSFFS